jgi:hypothetical protein
MDSNEVSFDKPGYDGRLNYHAILKQYMMAIAQSSYRKDFADWSLLLRDIFGMIAPYIKSDLAALSKKEINQCELMVAIMNNCVDVANKNIIAGLLRRRLREATDNLYERSKHLLLPVKLDTPQELNEEEFLRGSDL